MTEFEFEQQVTALTQKMYRVSASLLRSPQDRQDAVQECVWKAWRKLPQLRDESLFTAWIMRILVNECKRLCHSHWREVTVEEIEIEQPDGAAPRKTAARRYTLLYRRLFPARNRAYTSLPRGHCQTTSASGENHITRSAGRGGVRNERIELERLL